jgi:hypothetical protein
VETRIEVATTGRRTWIDPFTMERRADETSACMLPPYSSTLLCVEPHARAASQRRSAQDELQGSAEILGDIVSPVVPADAWDADSAGA